MEKQKLIKVYKSPSTHNCSYDSLAIDETLRLTEKEYSRFKKYRANLKQLEQGDIIRTTFEASGKSFIDIYKCCHARSGEEGHFWLNFGGSFGGGPGIMHGVGYTIEKINKKSFMDAICIQSVHKYEKSSTAIIEGCVNNLEKLAVDKKLKF